MNEFQRQYPLLSACGLNCGLCPRYYTDGSSKCPGCAGEGFFKVHPSCGVLSCCQRHSVEYCYQCAEYPCEKYEGANLFDSFITHQNMLKDFAKAKDTGLETYQAELHEKMKILQVLLDNYNDGRRKSFFCVAVNLLELTDIKEVLEQIATETASADLTLKEKSALVVRLLQALAEKRNIVLKLKQKK